MAQDKRLTKEEIQEDKFIEGLLKTYQFLKDHLRTILIVVGVVVVAVVGYAAYYQNQESRRVSATIALTKAGEAYRTAEVSLYDTEKLAESGEALKTAETELREVFEQHPNTAFADKARYQYANTLYYQGNYADARTQFQQIIDTHQPENQIFSLYAQKAIGNTYEQEGDYTKAIAAYQAQAFPPTPGLSPEIRTFVLTEAKFNEATVYEKSGDSEGARAAYKEIIDEYRATFETGIEQKSRELIQDAKVIIQALDETLDTAAAEKLEAEGRYYDAYVAYADAIRTYKVNRDVQGGLTTDLRKQIGNFEKQALAVIDNIQKGRTAEAEKKDSLVFLYYDRVAELDNFGLSRRLYEYAVLHYKRLGTPE